MSTEDVLSDPIREAIRIALGAGNRLTVVSSEWKPKQAVFMDRPIDAATKGEIARAFPSLEPFATEATPHNPATEGFADRESDVVIVFPAQGEQRRWYP